MNFEEAYKSGIFGVDEPDTMITASSKGPVMLTREAAYLLDQEGNIVGEVDREKWIAELKSKVFLEIKGIS